MNRDRVVNVVVLAAIALVIGWIAVNTEWTEVSVPTPLKGEAARNPFYATQRLAETLGARTEWRQNLGRLPAPDAVIVLWAWNWSLIKNRRESLERWVQAGGRLVIDRSLIGGEAELERWAGIALHFPEDEDEESPTTPPESEQCRTLELARGEPVAGTRRSYSVCGMDARSSLTSTRRPEWALSDAQGLQALRIPVGRGSVTLVNARPFVYRALFEFDHALLFTAVAQLQRGDELLFLSDSGGASLFDLMWRHGAPVILLSFVLLAFALWRGSARFGPLTAAPDAARRSLGEQIRGTGQFTLRFGAGQALHAASVRALREAADRRIPGFGALQAQDRTAALARATRLAPDALSAAIHYAGPRRPGELRSAIALLETARRMILNSSIRKQG